METATSLTITRPDDWHCHFRDGAMLEESVPASARAFARVIAMPNLTPPVINAEQALAYKARLQDHAKDAPYFDALTTLYLTDQTTPAIIMEAQAAGIVASKLYPAGATTNSSAAVNSLKALYPVFEAMQECGMLLLIHGEVTHSHVDIFDREAQFIEEHLRDIVEQFPELKIVFEHITTSQAADFVEESGSHLAATITPQHLLMNRNDLLVGGIKPHNYCLPVLKRETHQLRLRKAATSGNAKFFLGSDSAPHNKSAKESDCGCAGCYSAWAAIELYAQVFEEEGALDKLENFASGFGADFYQLPRNADSVTLIRDPWKIPDEIPLPDGQSIVPFMAGQTLQWRLNN